jgi:HlyD family type I secretion membrane fusion protein
MQLQKEIRRGWFIVIIGLGGFLLWAASAPLDEGIPASGVLAVESKRKQVAHIGGGIVEQILIEDGHKVREGDPLITLNEVQAKAELSSAEQQWWTSLATEARLQTELTGHSSISRPPQLQPTVENPVIEAIMKTQTDMLRARRSAAAGELRIIRESHRGLEAQLQSLDVLKNSRERQVELFREQLGSVQSLREQGFVSRNQALDLERQLSEVESRQSDDLSNISAIKSRLAELKIRETQYFITQRREIEAELSAVRREAGALAERVKALRDSHQRLAIRAPVSGTVVDVAVTTVGGVIRPGERVLDIVPDGDDLIVEARLDPRYVDRIRPGFPADLRFDAYTNGALQPLLQGEVKIVSADSILDERTGASYYKVLLTIPPDQRPLLGDIKLQSGMLCTVMVKTGERTLLAYLVQPLLRRFNGALAES